MRKADRKLLLAGGIFVSASLLAGWAAGRGGKGSLVEAAPMEVLLGEAGEAVEDGAATWDLPVEKNARVDQWISFLAGRNADKTQLWMERSGRYTPMIREQLRARGMPEDLIYLAFIESGYSPKAYSKAAASGIWQFIAETGRRYGLEVSSYVDERRDPVESTRAALDYLEALYKRFGSWYLAAAAYNSGENRVERILRERAGGMKGDDALFWRIAPYLPRETRDYVPLMLAAGHINKEPRKYGFQEVEFWQPLAYDTAWVPAQTSLSVVAKAAGVTLEDVNELNTHLLRGTTPPGRAWPVRIPRGTYQAFLADFPALFAAEQAEAKKVAASGRYHTILRGETLTHVAKQYGVSVNSILAANNGLSSNRLQIGQRVRVPGTAGGASAARTSAVASNSPRTATRAPGSTSRAATSRKIHQVRRGENLSVIAKRYNTSVGKLQKLNGLGRQSRIHPGQRLRVA